MILGQSWLHGVNQHPCPWNQPGCAELQRPDSRGKGRLACLGKTTCMGLCVWKSSGFLLPALFPAGVSPSNAKNAEVLPARRYFSLPGSCPETPLTLEERQISHALQVT